MCTADPLNRRVYISGFTMPCTQGLHLDPPPPPTLVVDSLPQTKLMLLCLTSSASSMLWQLTGCVEPENFKQENHHAPP